MVDRVQLQLGRAEWGHTHSSGTHTHKDIQADRHTARDTRLLAVGRLLKDFKCVFFYNNLHSLMMSVLRQETKSRETNRYTDKQTDDRQTESQIDRESDR